MTNYVLCIEFDGVNRELNVPEQVDLHLMQPRVDFSDGTRVENDVVIHFCLLLLLIFGLQQGSLFLLPLFFKLN